jgi:hypothetical protein
MRPGARIFSKNRRLCSPEVALDLLLSRSCALRPRLDPDLVLTYQAKECSLSHLRGQEMLTFCSSNE